MNASLIGERFLAQMHLLAPLTQFLTEATKKALGSHLPRVILWTLKCPDIIVSIMKLPMTKMSVLHPGNDVQASAPAPRCAGAHGESFLSRNSPRVRRFFMRRLPASRADADDLTQEVCARFLAVQHRASIVDADRYLFGIARHVLADFLAQRRARREVSLDSTERLEDANAWLADTAHDPAAVISASNLLRVLLDQLPASQRAVLIAHEGIGYSYREVAGQLGFTEQTVETYLKNAKAYLRTSRIVRSLPRTALAGKAAG